MTKPATATAAPAPAPASTPAASATPFSTDALRDLILGGNHLPTRRITVPAMNNLEITVRGLSGAEWIAITDEMEGARAGAKGDKAAERRASEQYRARLVASCVVNDQGARVFSDEDIPLVAEKLPAAALLVISTVVSQLSGLTKADAEVLEGNSAAAASVAG